LKPRAQVLRVTTRNARFQQWQALLTNRAKRHRAGEFLVQGVRPLTVAVAHNWDIHALLCRDSAALSSWAQGIVDKVGVSHFVLAPELMYELGGKQDDAPELLAVAGIPDDSLDRVPAGPDTLIVVFDRPQSPGNVGTVIRAADAFGAAAVLVSGHGADPYDPKAVRASTGSVFCLPVIRVAGPDEFMAWVAAIRQAGTPLEVVAADERGEVDATDYDFTGPRALLVGTESRGLSTAWRHASDTVVRVPMVGSASSLNAAMAATVILYEAARQRAQAMRDPVPPRGPGPSGAGA